MSMAAPPVAATSTAYPALTSPRERKSAIRLSSSTTRIRIYLQCRSVPLVGQVSRSAAGFLAHPTAAARLKPRAGLETCPTRQVLAALEITGRDYNEGRRSMETITVESIPIVVG